MLTGGAKGLGFSQHGNLFPQEGVFQWLMFQETKAEVRLQGPRFSYHTVLLLLVKSESQGTLPNSTRPVLIFPDKDIIRKENHRSNPL